MKRTLCFISGFLLSHSALANIQREIDNEDGKVSQYHFYVLNDELKKCDEAESCETIFHYQPNYCSNETIDQLTDALETIARIKWECPKYLAHRELKETFGIRLSDNPIFFDYAFNLHKLLSSFPFQQDKNRFYVKHINTTVGLSPYHIDIPADINDVVANITLTTNPQGYIESEQYELENGITIFRRYAYTNEQIQSILTQTIKNHRVIAEFRSTFE